MAEENGLAFDDGAQEALTLLLEHYWIFREEQPEQYHLIRQYEPILRPYLFEKCGWRLIQNPQFYKLEKIPSEPEPWMGISDFQQPRDYALLCCILAFLEEKSVDEQFLLSDLCESILALYPHEVEAGERLNWENYEHRRSLVRALRFAAEAGLVRLVDGDGEQFAMRRDSEALYEATLMARYFLRSYPKDLHQYQSLQDLQSAEHFDEEAATGTGRRVRVYRQLLLTPAYNAADGRPEDFIYLRSMHKRLRDELESRTGLQFELYKDCAMLTSPERINWCKQVFPFHQNGIHAVILHFARWCRDERQAAPDWRGVYTPVELERMVDQCRNRYGSGWTKEYRELGLSKLAAALTEELIAWKMAVADPETKLIELRPPFWRLEGRYPDNYSEK
ncbi:uncharacterized protein (TIGR02678 family) [Hydrogenispora ethanolica]|uniref:Uncharacterized protein (TIGR02678 family) n=1 Tax=Hydrogenispora ethanolica TaxID=1082276 RepID=A0A4R1R7J1_HYDET|nr:TIGR02678 family protein [Hydrogenispora ethanolica]TCL61469.1 uncharacterized protein (TIGR02678 family) [Hydrogenispora ethanolica]